MAKCNQLTPVAFKGLNTSVITGKFTGHRHSQGQEAAVALHEKFIPSHPTKMRKQCTNFNTKILKILG